jgi:hypothetical protein
MYTPTVRGYSTYRYIVSIKCTVTNLNIRYVVNEKLPVACARTWCMRAQVGQQIDKSAKNEHQHFQYLWITINVLMFGTLLTLKAVEVGPNILYVCKYYFY